MKIDRMILVVLLCANGEAKALPAQVTSFLPAPPRHPQLEGLFLISYLIQMEKRPKAAPTVDLCEAAIQGPGFLTKR